MKKIIVLAFTLLFCSYFAQAEIVGTIGTVEASPGDVVYLPVTFDGLNGNNAPIAIDFKFEYDNTQLTPVGSGFANYCSEMPQSLWMGNPYYEENIMSNNLAEVYSIQIPDGTKIFDLVFTYTGTTTAVVSFNPETLIFNDVFDELEPEYISGGVTPAGAPPGLSGTIGTVEANPGDVVYLPVTFNGLNGDNAPLAIDFKFEYDNTQLTPVGTGFANYCSEMPQSLWMGNPYYEENIMSNNLAEVYSIQIPDGTKIFDLVFTYTGTTTAVVSFNPETLIFNDVFDELEPEYISGGVTPASGVPSLLAPVLVSPVNGSTEQETTVNLVWEAVEGALSYNIELSTGPDFGFAVFYETEGTSYEVTGLEEETTYYWRVNAFNDVEESDWSEAWNFTTKAGVQYEFAGVIGTVEANPGDIVYIPVTFYGLNGDNAPIAIDFKFEYDNTQLTPVESGFANYCSEMPQSLWMGNPYYEENIMSNNLAEVYSIQIPDGTKIFDLVFTYTGTTTAVVSFNPETLIFNDVFDELAPEYISGGVTPAGGPPPLQAPVLVSPENGATGLTVDQVILEWEAVEGADYYTVEILETPDFVDPYTFDTPLTSLGLMGFDYLTTYYWRVKAVNENDESEWSEVWSFVTEEEEIPEPPAAPALIYPENAAVGIPIDPATFEWEAVEGAVYYTFECADDIDGFVDPVLIISTYETELDVYVLDYLTTYYWHVKAVNENGDSEWSEVWSFVTEEEEIPEPPAAPALIYPANAAVDIPIDPATFEWEAVEGADYYTFECTDDIDGFVDPLIISTYETELDVHVLDYLTTYYWHVKAVNENGDSEWSEVWSFTTAPFIPEAPVLIAPIDASEDLPLAVDFSWNVSEGADSYYIEVATDISFNGIVLGEEVFGTEYQDEFEYATTYFWHVKAIAEGYESEWSQVWAFTTKSEFVPAPVLLSPLNNTSDVSIEGIDLTWEITFPAVESFFEVSANDIFSDILASGWTEETTVFFGDLAYDTQYFWRVKAISDLENLSEWSVAWSFTTESAPVPEAPVLLTPLNEEVGVPTVEINFTWEEVETAIEYYIEVATAPIFSNNIVYYGTVYNNEATAYNLLGLTTYYWRVNATNELGGISEWSEVWSFQTGEADPFIWTANTGNNATVIIPYDATPTINRVPIQEGDWVAAFSPLGFCVGAIEWAVQPPPQVANHLTVWGDNDQTPETDGMIVGQTIGYKFFKVETGEYYTANIVQYEEGTGLYAANGYYVTSELAYLDEDWVDPPVLVSPADGSINLSPASVEFSWNVADNANMYNFELSPDPDFGYAIAKQTSQTTFEEEGLNYGTTYYWRVNGFNDNFTSEWSEVWSFTTEREILCDPPTLQAKNIIFSSVTAQSMKVRWTRGNGEKVLVVAYPGEVDAAPELYNAYTADPVYGEGSMIGSGYVIYNGTGDRVDVTGLFGGVLYTFKVYEYNYSECIAYNVNSAANNPRSKSTLPAAPVIIPTTYKTETGFLAEWTYNGSVDAFEIYLYNSNGNLIEDYDVGNVNSVFIDELDPTTLYYYAVIANYGGSYSFSSTEPVITLDVEPIAGPTGLTAELGLLDNTVDLSWVKPTGAARTIIIAYDYDPVELIASPEDATEYEFNSNFSNAPELYNGKVVYIGTGQNTTITGLEPFTQYFFNVFVFNGGVVTQYNTYPLNTHNYYTQDFGAIDIWNIAVPTPVLLTPDNKWEEGFSTYWEYDVDEDPDLFELLINNDVYDIPGELRDLEVDDLSPNTLYNIKIRAYYGLNDVYSDWSNIEQIKTLATEPDQPTNLVFTEIADVSLRVTWTKAQNAEKTIVVAYNLGSYNSGIPLDNVGYPAGNASFGDGTALGDGYIVYNGTGNTFVLTNLLASGSYHFELYAYNGSGNQGDEILNSFNYNTDPLTGDAQTAVSAPTEAPSNVHFPTIGTTQLNVAWTTGDGSNSIVLAKTDSYPFTAPFNGESYSSDAVYGLGDNLSGAYVVYNGSGDNVTVTGLAEGTTYYFAVYTFNGFGTGTVYLSEGAFGNETTKQSAPPPAGQDRVITFRNSTPTSVGLTWLLPASGAGTYRIALAKAGSPIEISDFPVSGTTYTANAGYGLGDLIGGAYVVYNAAAVPTIATPLTVTGLASGTTYHFRIFAYNITGDGSGTESYNLNSAVFNPREKVAGSREALAGDEFDGYEGNAQFNLSSIAPNPVTDLVNFTMNVYESSPVTIEIYNADGNRVMSIQESKTMSVGEHSFSIPTGNIAAGLYILKVSTGGSEFAIQSFIVMP